MKFVSWNMLQVQNFNTLSLESRGGFPSFQQPTTALQTWLGYDQLEKGKLVEMHLSVLVSC